MPTFKATKINNMTVVVDVYLDNETKYFDILSAPDAHWDNPKCKRDLLKADFDEAKKLKACIIMPGDTFCFMQGKYDPRRNKADIRPEHNVSNYVDAVIKDAAEWFTPYKENIVAIGTGNHESAILKSQETNVLERLAGYMNGEVNIMGYHGWVLFNIYLYNVHRSTYKLYFNHGAGGGGIITRGQIEFSRMMMSVHGADAITMGHVHEKSTNEVMVHYFDNNPQAMCPKVRSMLLLRSSTYKQEYSKNGFHIERQAPPKPLGGTWLRVYISKDSKGVYKTVAEPRFKTTETFTFHE